MTRQKQLTVSSPTTVVQADILCRNSVIHVLEYGRTVQGARAREEGFVDIANWVETLAKAERSHAGKFAKALDTL